jgi:hypothetical protein
MARKPQRAAAGKLEPLRAPATAPKQLYGFTTANRGTASGVNPLP